MYINGLRGGNFQHMPALSQHFKITVDIGINNEVRNGTMAFVRQWIIMGEGIEIHLKCVKI